MCELNIDGSILYRILAIIISFIFTVFFGSGLIYFIKNTIKEIKSKNNIVTDPLIKSSCYMLYINTVYIISIVVYR